MNEKTVESGRKVNVKFFARSELLNKHILTKSIYIGLNYKTHCHIEYNFKELVQNQHGL